MRQRSVIPMKRCFSQCCGGEDDDGEATSAPAPPSQEPPQPVKLVGRSSKSAVLPSSVANGHALPTGPTGAPNSFLRLAPDNPWLVCRSPEHNGKLFWLHETTHETTWKQPLPRMTSLPKWPLVDERMRDFSQVVSDQVFFGA